MAQQYFCQFGNGNPTTYSGLNPTFIAFYDYQGNAITPPSINEPGSKGVYQFTYSPTLPIFFTMDAATTGLTTAIRYITGALYPDDLLGELTGTTVSSYGDNVTDPTTLFGFLKRGQEIMEGDQIYTKATGVLDEYSRGQTTLLRSKTITDTATDIEKV